MKTLIVFDDGQGVKYALLDGDYSRFHNQYIGMVGLSAEQDKELSSFFYEDDGTVKPFLTMLDKPYLIPDTGEDIILVFCGQML